METFLERPHHLSLFELALANHMATEAQHLIIITDNPSTNEDQIMKAIITETNPNAAKVMDPFNVGEVISKTTPINGASPFPHHPHGIISYAGDVEAVIESLRPWINPEAKVGSDSGAWSWADAIETNLRDGNSVNFDELPAGVVLSSLPETQVAACNAHDPVEIPEGWTGESLMETVFAQRQFQNSGVDRR